MDYLLSLIVFGLGAIIGSFLNVVIYRYNTGQGLGGRSRCMSCARNLRWLELIPIFSFVAQGARCRNCLVKLSWQYPLVELMSGVLFVLVWQQFNYSLPVTLFYFVIWSLLLVITVYDLRHKIIPDGFVYGFIILALLKLFFFGQVMLLDGLLAGGVAFLFFFLLWYGSRGRWMGFGDAKLALGVGLLLGLRGALSAIIFAFWLGAVVGVLLVLIKQLWPRGKSFTIKSEIPFAPFIILGLALNLFFQLDVLNLIGSSF